MFRLSYLSDVGYIGSARVESSRLKLIARI